MLQPASLGLPLPCYRSQSVVGLLYTCRSLPGMVWRSSELDAMQGNLSIRYVPHQNADALLSHLTRHLQHEFRKLRTRNTLSVDVRGRGWAPHPLE